MTGRPTVLLVDDESAILETLSLRLSELLPDRLDNFARMIEPVLAVPGARRF